MNKTTAKATAKHLSRRTWAIRHALTSVNYRTPVEYRERLAVYAELLRDRVAECAEISPEGTKKAYAAAWFVADRARQDADYAAEQERRYA